MSPTTFLLGLTALAAGLAGQSLAQQPATDLRPRTAVILVPYLWLTVFFIVWRNPAWTA